MRSHFERLGNQPSLAPSRRFAVALMLLIVGSTIPLVSSGCGDGRERIPQATAEPTSSAATTRSSKLRIVTSFFPIHLFVRNVVVNVPDVELALLINPEQGCPHNYDLKPKDRKTLADANVFVMNGCGMEEFIDSLKKANPAMTMVDTSVGIETMEGTCDHDHGDGKAGEEHVHAQNPHFFSSPKRAIQQVKNIVARLAEIDPPHADLYRKNGDAYIAKLEAVSNKIVEARKSLKSNELVTMHGIFDYLAQDYDLDIVGNLQADHNVDPSANKMKKLVELIKKEKVKAVFTEPQYPTAPAEALAKAAGVKVATLDPVAAGPADAPLDYYESIMTKNIDVLIDVLGR